MNWQWIWIRSLSFNSEIPSDEKFGIISQIRRSTISIPSNIAEGEGRNTKNEF